jgi:hypothetical protein
MCCSENPRQSQTAANNPRREFHADQQTDLLDLTILSSRHSFAILSGAVFGENREKGSSAPAISHIMRRGVNPLKVSNTATITVPPGRTTRRISATASCGPSPGLR